MNKFSLTTDGRIGRLEYFFTSFLFLCFFFIIISGIYFLGFDRDSFIYNITFIIGYILYFWINTVCCIKRFHDLNKRGKSFALLFIPFVNIYFGIILLFKKGTIGPNKYGPDPLQKENQTINNITPEMKIDL